MGQAEVLEWLREHKQGTAYEIAEDLDMTVGRIFRSIIRLEEKNMLEVKRIQKGRERMLYVFVRGD